MITNEQEFYKVLEYLRAFNSEVEWIEFKQNNFNQEDIGEYLSAISNAAGLHRREVGYIVFGIEDSTHNVAGTTFKPRQQKVGNEEIENWLAIRLHPRIDFRIYQYVYNGKPVVLFEVPSCRHTPVRWMDTEFIRVGSYKKKLKDYPEKERALWLLLSETPYEREAAVRDVSGNAVLELLDYPAYFHLTKQNLPSEKAGILDRLNSEKIIRACDTGSFDITNLGALLFAKHLPDFSGLGRKAVRVIIYRGVNRIETKKEHIESRGYANGFESLVAYINDQLPRNEQIGQALRQEVRMYPELAIRELVANAIIHQDLTMTGDSPTIEIFDDRIEITNSGRPLIDTLRFIDEPPQSRNEAFASFMRRLNMCEERGSGIDKVIFTIEFYQLPPPDFLVTQNHTKAMLFTAKKLSEMENKDKIRACYQHACLLYVSNQEMTNTSLRQRLSIEDQNYSIASRIIADTIRAGLIKAYDPQNVSKRLAKYVPFWA